MAKSATPSGLFVRQASGLVRDVSMTNALFFNIAAFVGTAVGWAIAFYALYPEWQAFGISAYAYIAVLTAMPRSGGDYVFTSRIISPFWGWIESWTLVGSALTIIGFEIIVASHNLQLIGILLGVVFPSSVFGNAQNWLQDNPSKIIVGIIIMLVIAGIAILKTRTFHKVVTGLTIFAIISVLINFIGAFTIDSNSMNNALPALGTSSKAIMNAATKAGFSLGSPDFSLLGLVGLAGLASVVLFQYIGFQFSSYIARVDELGLHGCAGQSLWLYPGQCLGLPLLEWCWRSTQWSAAIYPGDGNGRSSSSVAAVADCGVGQHHVERLTLPSICNLPLAYRTGLGA